MPRCGRMEEIMSHKFTDENFKSEVLESKQPVLVDFYADWCGPCKMMAPIVDALAEEYKDKIKIGKLNIDENPKTPGDYGVLSIPTIVLIQNGEMVEKIVGSVPKEKLVALFEGL